MTAPPASDAPMEKLPEKKKTPTVPVSQKIEQAARKLERLLGGDMSFEFARKEAILQSTPGKIVRRWLGTSSGTAAKSTPESIALAASNLLDPHGPSAAGLHLLLALVPVSMSDAEEKKEEKKNAYLRTASREAEGWLISLATRALYRASRAAEGEELATRGLSILQSHVTARSRLEDASSLYPLLSRLYRYRALCDPRCRAEELARAHRLACIRRDVDCQATILNLMLRSLLAENRVERAQKLISNSTFPERAMNNQLCRYLYYSGRTQALRLEYTMAFSNLSQALRKCPTNTALGFRIALRRLLVVVQLLMGEIPERAVFFEEGMRRELRPYLEIARGVRRGDLSAFRLRVGEWAERLREDGTYTLISRLAHSVVKAGLRRLNASYSRISLEEVAGRLGLRDAGNAEFVVAKAIRDGVIDATIDHEGGFVRSHDLVDIYATVEPAEAFHRRIAYCLTTHNDAVRGMRYPPDAYKKQLEASRGQKNGEGDEKTDEEKAQELEDELDEDF